MSDQEECYLGLLLKGLHNQCVSFVASCVQLVVTNTHLQDLRDRDSYLTVSRETVNSKQ